MNEIHNVMNVNDFLSEIESFEKDFIPDTITSPTMTYFSEKMKTYLSLLSECSKLGEIYLTLHKNSKEINEYSENYKNLQNEGVWKIARYILKQLYQDETLRYYFKPFQNIEIDNADSLYGDTCFFCNKEFNVNRATMHHVGYKKNNLFNPKYIVFSHYKCHREYHNLENSFTFDPSIDSEDIPNDSMEAFF
jgi:hypothetical protein